MIQAHQVFYINSANRISGTDENFSYLLPIDVTANYDSVCVLSASIPRSYYLVQSGFNTFTLQEDVLTATITVPAGNYSYLSFMAVLPTLLNNASPNGWTYSISYPSRLIEADTGRFTFTVTGNSGTQPSFIVDSSALCEQLGLEPNTTNTFVGDTLTSTTVINFTPEETLFLHSDCANNKSDDILQEIYDWNSPPMSYIVYQNYGLFEPYSKKLTISSTRTVAISLTNENGTLINLNKRNMLVTLCIYKRDNLPDVLRSLVRIKLMDK